MRPHRIVPFLLLALTAVVFQPVRDHEFVDYDDHVYVVENPNLRDGLGVESVVRAFTTPYTANWIPLTWISLQIDHEFYGLEPAGYHLTNVALHTLSALLLFFALSRMTRAPWPSAFVAAVFAIHPLHVESVAWATERKNVLCGLFWMLTLCAHAHYAEKPQSGRRYALGDAEEGIRHSREALRLDPAQLFAANNLAWALATHPNAALRNPQEAVRVAETALAYSGGESPDLLDTLAAAYASAGRFEEAVRAETDALRIANARGEALKAADYQVRLTLYRAEKPFVDGAALPTAEATMERHGGL